MKLDADDYAARAAEAAAMRPPNLPTEAMVGPLELGIARSWTVGKRPADGNWYGLIDCPPFRQVWECNHSHTTADGAWRCAAAALRVLVEHKADPSNYEWDADDEERR